MFYLDPPPQFPAPPPMPPALVAKAPAVRTGYPLRGNLWSGYTGWQHLTTGEHAGRYPVEWLKTLTFAEGSSLHSDDHEGRVRWEYVPGKTQLSISPKLKVIESTPASKGAVVKESLTVQPASAVTYSLLASMSGCPGGRCDNQPAQQRRGLFGWR